MKKMKFQSMDVLCEAFRQEWGNMGKKLQDERVQKGGKNEDSDT